jgi:hypothetical protein
MSLRQHLAWPYSVLYTLRSSTHSVTRPAESLVDIRISTLHIRFHSPQPCLTTRRVSSHQGRPRSIHTKPQNGNAFFLTNGIVCTDSAIQPSDHPRRPCMYVIPDLPITRADLTYDRDLHLSCHFQTSANLTWRESAPSGCPSTSNVNGFARQAVCTVPMLNECSSLVLKGPSQDIASEYLAVSMRCPRSSDVVGVTKLS